MLHACKCKACPHGLSMFLWCHMQLSGSTFDHMFVSTLARASETADIVTAGMHGPPRTDMPVLREIDLYSFQVRRPNPIASTKCYVQDRELHWFKGQALCQSITSHPPLLNPTPPIAGFPGHAEVRTERRVCQGVQHVPHIGDEL